MKILWQTEHYPDTRKGGGSVTNTTNITHALEQLGETVSILSSNEGLQETFAEDTGNGRQIRFSCPKLPDPLWPIWPFLQPTYLKQPLASIVASFNAFVCHDPGYALALKRLYPKRPLVSRIGGAARIHDAYVSIQGDGVMSLSGLKRRFWRRLLALENDWMDRQAWSAADALVVQSEFMKTDMVKFYNIPSQKIRVVPSGVDYERFAVTHPSESGSAVLANNRGVKMVVAFCGRLVRMKNVSYLLRGFAAMRHRDRSVLLIIGDGEDRPNLEAEAGRLGISRDVQFVGHAEQVETLLRTADVFVLPSVYEPFANALLEAMAAGLPCIALAPLPRRVRTSCAEVIMDGQTGYLVDGTDPQDLARRLDNLAENPAHRKDMGAKAQARCREEYTWRVCADNYLLILKELTASLKV